MRPCFKKTATKQSQNNKQKWYSERIFDNMYVHAIILYFKGYTNIKGHIKDNYTIIKLNKMLEINSGVFFNNAHPR